MTAMRLMRNPLLKACAVPDATQEGGGHAGEKLDYFVSSFNAASPRSAHRPTIPGLLAKYSAC